MVGYILLFEEGLVSRRIELINERPVNNHQYNLHRVCGSMGYLHNSFQSQSLHCQEVMGFREGAAVYAGGHFCEIDWQLRYKRFVFMRRASTVRHLCEADVVNQSDGESTEERKGSS